MFYTAYSDTVDILWRLEVFGPLGRSDVTERWEGNPNVEGKRSLMPVFGGLQKCTYYICTEDVVTGFRNRKCQNIH